MRMQPAEYPGLEYSINKLQFKEIALYFFISQVQNNFDNFFFFTVAMQFVSTVIRLCEI